MTASLPGAGYGRSSMLPTAWLQNSKKRRTVREIDVLSRVTAIISALVICIIVCPSWAVNHYRDNAITHKAQRDKNARELKLANAAITDMQMRQREAAALDAKYTKELADAKAENDALRDDVAAGRRRLHIRCQPVISAALPRLGGGYGFPWLADTAERDYFTLRERSGLPCKNNRKEPSEAY